MGLCSALVYLLAIVNFLPFAFKRDIAAAAFGINDKNRVIEAGELENGRFLHRFPLEKVGSNGFTIAWLGRLTLASSHLTASRMEHWRP
jgi:UDP-N-acetylglucosamine--dolichyl-phosphate N-acetylglucosaminephosphotransferase